MSKFDETKFRSAAKAAGYSDEEIDAELGTPAGSAPPIGMAGADETRKEFDKEFEQQKATLKKDYQEKTQEIETTSPFTLPGFLTSPPALVTGAALLGALTTYAAPKVYKSVKERFMSKTPDAPIRIDPIGFEAFANPLPSTQPNVNQAPTGQSALTPEELQARAAQLKPTAPQAPQAVAPQAPKAPQFTPAVPMTPEELAASFRGEAPKAPIATPLSAAPVEVAAPTPSAKPNSAVTDLVANEVKDLIHQVDQPIAPPGELRTGTGKPAFAGMGPEAALNKSGQPKLKTEYPGMEAVPRGMAFVPNAQYIDTLRQNIGQPDYTSIFTQRDFPLTNEMAIEQSKEINRSLGRATRAEAKAAGLPPAEITPGITKKTSAGTKPVRVAGTVGALMAISDLAKAETPGQRGMAGAGLLEAVLPPGFMMGGAGEGSGNVPSMNAAMLLGSPYAQSDFAKRKRQEEEYIRKIGAGRGIAPPSAYQR